MTRHNPAEDAVARTALENALADAISDVHIDVSHLDPADGTAELNGEPAMMIAREVAKAFEFVEYDRAHTRIPAGNGRVHLRRFVLTGGWEVDPAPDRDEG